MKIKDLICDICHWNNLNFNNPDTVDKYHFGNPDNEVTRVAVTMFASIEVIKKAIDFGAELLIVHEPIFNSNEEKINPDNPVHQEKIRLINEGNLTLFRYHDHPHWMQDDFIDNATIKYSGLKGRVIGKPFWAVTAFELDEPMSGAEVRNVLADKLNASWSRIAGSTDTKGKNIAFACGTPGHIMELLLDDHTDFIVTGEICEWIYGELARDLAAIGKNKTIIVMGHCRSEYAGMIEVSNLLQEKFPQLVVKHIESKDVYR